MTIARGTEELWPIGAQDDEPKDTSAQHTSGPEHQRASQKVTGARAGTAFSTFVPAMSYSSHVRR
jgi:hypothetical protein